MRLPGSAALPRLPLLLAVALATVGLVLASSLRSATQARPPSTEAPIPADAFRPIALPDQGVRSRIPSETAGQSPSEQWSTSSSSQSPSPPRGPIHVVRAGDTLWQIALWHRTDLELILGWNQRLDPRRLIAGQQILVAGGAPIPARPNVSAARPASSPTRGWRPPASGRHLWPLPVPGVITTRFSAAHPGIDIAAPAGTPVRAIAAGTVTWAGWKTNGGGYVVVVRHPDGMVSTYNHSRGLAVRRGAEVTAGQTIAWVGASGWATGPHLDLRIEMSGRLVDPVAVY